MSRSPLRGKHLRTADPDSFPDAATLREALGEEFGALNFVAGHGRARTLWEWMDAPGTPTQFDVELPDGECVMVRYDPTAETFVEVVDGAPAARRDLRRVRRTEP